MPFVEIYDTTLRDGAQGEGISFSLADKIKLALQLDKLGVHYIEGGWPGSNPKDEAFFHMISERRLTSAKIAAFGATRKPGGRPETDSNIQMIVSTRAPVATLFGKSWDLHVFEALATTLEENLIMIRDSVAYLKSRGKEVIYDAEHFFDGYKNNPVYALATLAAACEGGADRIVLCDTNGGSLPHEIGQIVRLVSEQISIPYGIHAHNDGELAVANSLAAVEAGATQVQGTLNGYGERCGNANLCSIIANLSLKMGCETIPAENLAMLSAVSRYASELANVHHLSNQPFVGESAFTHKGGIHVSAVQKNPRTYEHIPPEAVGNKRKAVVSELSGVSNLVYKYKDLNLPVDKDSPKSRRLLEEIKALENQGFQFELAEGSLELLMRKVFEDYRVPFDLESLKVIIQKEGQSVTSEAVIKMKVGNEVVHTAAEGKGPVGAIDNALRKVLERFYPAIKDMYISDFKVRILDGSYGSESFVRVILETSNGKSSWGTLGVSANIVEASWQALVDSMAYGLLKAGRENDTAGTGR